MFSGHGGIKPFFLPCTYRAGQCPWRGRLPAARPAGSPRPAPPPRPSPRTAPAGDRPGGAGGPIWPPPTGERKTTPLHPALGIRWSVEVMGELKGCSFFPLLYCYPKGILSGGDCGICGILFGSSFGALYRSIAKSCWVFLGPSYLVAPFCILLRRLKCALFQTLLNSVCL